MVSIRLHRIGSEGLAESPTRVALQRESYEAAVDEGGAQEIRLHRIGAEVLAKSPTKVAVQREVYEAAVTEGGAQEVQLHRIGAGGLAKSPPRVALQRISYEAVTDQGTAQEIRLHRIAVEVLARGALPPPEPLPLAENLSFFMQNWVDKVVIETAYQTDVFRAPNTGAEERTSRTQRPDRVMELYWMRNTKAEIHQLLKLLRRLTDENLQIPLYPDVVDVTSALTPIGFSVSCDTSNRRFFVGARVLMFPAANTYVAAEDAIVRTIESLTGSSLTFTEAHGMTVAANTLAVVPLIDCEIALDPAVLMQTDEAGEVRLTVREVHSNNALPPFRVGNPDGAVMRNGYPVFEPDVNWLSGLASTFRRNGAEQRQGLRVTPVPEGERFVLETNFNLSPLVREDWAFTAGFFDSRRGRARAFWVVDRHDTYTMISNLATSVTIEPFGEFEDFEQYWLEDHIGVGIVMEDGNVYVATVFSITDNGSTWKLTLDIGQTLPILDPTEIVRLARARLSRFETDAMRETWETNTISTVSLTTVEVPNEKEVEF